METYIAFLRAINVGGHTVKMARLRELFEELGFGNVRSYIQSGNVFFESAETDRELLTSTIERHLAAALGYEVGVFLRTIPEVESLLALDPFKEVEVTPDVRLCVLFTTGPLPADLTFPLHSLQRDVTIIGMTSREIFLVMHIVNGRPVDPSRFVQSTVDSRSLKTTSRFFHTTAKILAAAKQA